MSNRKQPEEFTKNVKQGENGSDTLKVVKTPNVNVVMKEKKFNFPKPPVARGGGMRDVLPTPPPIPPRPPMQTPLKTEKKEE